MDERGDGLTASNAATARRSRASAHLGSTLRTILISPRRGFAGALAAIARREATGQHPVEGIAPYVLSAIGGTGAMLLWLKIGTLVGVRRISATDFRWSLLIVVLIGGAVLALAAQGLWGLAARMLVPGAGSSLFRFVWGAAVAPLAFVVLPLLPLDLLLVGSETFTATKLTDPLETGWAALSIALSVSVAVWSGYLFYRGVQVAGELRAPVAVAAVALGVICAGVVTLAVAIGLNGLAGG